MMREEKALARLVFVASQRYTPHPWEQKQMFPHPRLRRNAVVAKDGEKERITNQKGEAIMVTITLCCRHCGSEDLIRNGHASNGKQKYYCKSCKRRSRENPAPNGDPEERKEEIIRSYQERSSGRRLTRTFGVARNTVSDWLKKRQESCLLWVKRSLIPMQRTQRPRYWR